MRLNKIGCAVLVAAMAGGMPAFAAPAVPTTGTAVVVTTAPGKVVVTEEPKEDPLKAQLDLGTLLVTIAIFVCLFIVLKSTAWKPILAGLKSREDAIRDSIEGAKKAKAETEKVTKELQDKIATVQRQALAELTQVKADALKLGETVRQQAEADAAALKERTLREIEAAKQQALNEINTKVVALGTAIAGKILQRNVTVDDQQRLVDESLGELAKKN